MICTSAVHSLLWLILSLRRQVAVRINSQIFMIYTTYIYLQTLHQVSMSIFKADTNEAKIAADLTSLAVMNATSKYVKEGPVPVGSYEQPRTFQPNQRYGADRRLQRKPQDSSTVKSQVSAQSNEVTTSKISLAVEQVNKIINKHNEAVASQKQEVNQVPQVNTPKAPRVETLAYQKIEKISQTPRNPHPPKSMIDDIFDKTPTQSNRYGANRRPLPQKTQQLTQKTDPQPHLIPETQLQANKLTPSQNKQRNNLGQAKSELIKATQTPAIKQIVNSVEKTPTQSINRYGTSRRVPVQKPEVPDVQNASNSVKQQIEITPIQNKQVKPFTRNNTQIPTPTSGSSNVRTPVAQRQSANIEYTNEKEQSEQVKLPEKSDAKVITRSNVRPQLKSRLQTPAAKKENETEAGKEQVGIKPKKQSKIICYLLNNIYRSKLIPVFESIQEINRVSKKKQNLIRIFLGQLHSISKRIDNELKKLTFNKIVKVNKTPHAAVKLDGAFVQNMKQKNQNMLIILLNHLYAKQCSYTNMKLRSYKKKATNPTHLINGLSRIPIKSASIAFNKLKSFSTHQFNERKRLLSTVNFTSIQYRLNFLKLALRKLSNVKKDQEKNKTVNLWSQKGSPIQEFDQDLSSQQQTPSPSHQKSDKNQKLIESLEQAFKQNSLKLQNIEQQLAAERNEVEKKVDGIRIQCEELSHQNEEKKKISQQLKEKALSIQFREEDYIETPDLILDTKFPILYEAYIKIEKSTAEDVKISSLLNMFPGCAEEAARDKQVTEWMEIYKNWKLKQEVGRYEGEQESLRKATKIASQEVKLLNQLSRGYIKERYSWEWVKSALMNVPHS